MVKDAACIAVYGRRGSGKSTRTKSMIGGHKRVVVFDPQGEYGGLPGFRRCTTLAGVLGAVKAGWRSGFRVAYMPRGDFPRMLHGVCRMLWVAQAPYERGQDRRKVLLVVEEMNLAYPAARLPSEFYGMSRAVLQGRHRGIEIIGVTQRPALVSADFRGQVAETYVFPLSTSHDFKAVCEVYGKEHEPALRALEPHRFLRFVDGQVKPGRNPPIRPS